MESRAKVGSDHQELGSGYDWKQYVFAMPPCSSSQASTIMLTKALSQKIN